MDFLFSKYSGCGNDFVLIDDRKEVFPFGTPGLIPNICNRWQGIGADGLILLQQSAKADFRMRIFNADGTEAEMCGNGIRCLMKFIEEIGLEYPCCTIETSERILSLTREQDDVRVEMGRPQDVHWNVSLDTPQGRLRVHRLNTGVPHAVEFVEGICTLDMKERGAQVRHHQAFAPKGTNYNAASVSDNGRVSVRTYERGVEDETLACGTGAAAAALAAANIYGLKSPVAVQTKSGETLTFHFDGAPDRPEVVWMTGPARKIYNGSASLKFFLSRNAAEYKVD